MTDEGDWRYVFKQFLTEPPLDSEGKMSEHRSKREATDNPNAHQAGIVLATIQPYAADNNTLFPLPTGGS